MPAKTIPISVANPTPGNRNPLKWQKIRNRSIGFLVALCPPAICSYVMASWVLGGSSFLESGGIFLQSSWGCALIAFIMVCGALNGMATCSPNNALLGMAIAAVLHFMPQGSGIAALVVGATLLISLNQAKRVYENLQAKSFGPLPRETRNELNPKCETCHARSVCPYQPGGIADRYTDEPDA